MRSKDIHSETCWLCGGSGDMTDLKTKKDEPCSECDGSGEVLSEDQNDE